MKTSVRLAVAAVVTEIIALWTLNWVLAIVGLGVAGVAIWKLPYLEEQTTHE